MIAAAAPASAVQYREQSAVAAVVSGNPGNGTFAASGGYITSHFCSQLHITNTTDNFYITNSLLGFFIRGVA